MKTYMWTITYSKNCTTNF